MNAGRKKGLGRGLSALFGDSLPKEEVQAKNQSNMVAIADLSRNPYQPRQNFKEEKLTELANSIKKNGIIQPIAVRPSKSDSGKYEIVAGERRWLAAQRAGLHEIPIKGLACPEVKVPSSNIEITSAGKVNNLKVLLIWLLLFDISLEILS